MRALILSDIHANMEALAAVLDAAGDMVGYGASPNEVLETIRPLAGMAVRGNHDRVCSGLTSTLNFNPTARKAALWTLEQLSPDNLVWLRGVPQGPLTPEPGGVGEAQVSLAHGSPLNEDQYILNMRDAWAPLQQMGTAITFVGHTHIQGGFSQKEHDWHELRPRFRSQNEMDTWTLAIPAGTRNLINPGSVGQPRDYDWRAAFAIYDSAREEVIYFRVPYDLAGAQGRILMAGLPERLAARLREGR
jgi:diadenosine tetraphosphatase ApaH/serine/threonine PP2A family protein phosphatase